MSATETVYRGVPISHGIGIGPVFVAVESFPLDAPAYRLRPEDVPAELKRLRQALRLAREDVARVREEAERRIGKRDAGIFVVHLQVLDDPSLQRDLEEAVRSDAVNAEAAVANVIGRYADVFERLQDPLARDRAADLRDVGRRILGHLRRAARPGPPPSQPDEAFVLVTRELLPSDTVGLDRRRLAGIVTETGGPGSHAAILARALGIPAVSGIRDLASLLSRSGKLAVVDGREGLVVVDPAPETLDRYRRAAAALERVREAIEATPELPAVTRDGTPVEIHLNIENAQEVRLGDLDDLAGIGLFRTEFVYMERNSFPSEDEQYEIYREVVERARPKPVVFRTLDVGGDKPLPYFRTQQESNPALGWRGFRISDEWPDLFIAQARALLRASAHGVVRIMLPMVTTVEEVQRARAILDDLLRDLERRGVEHADHVPLGIMVEVPSCVECIDHFLPLVDFVSIGTNDLIQYLLAADRNNARVARFSDPFQPALLRAIRRVARAADEAGKEISLCGEMAGSYYSAMVLLGLGLRRLSMPRHYVPGVRKLVASVTIPETEEVAARALRFATAGEVRAYVTAKVRDVLRRAGVPIEEGI